MKRALIAVISSLVLTVLLGVQLGCAQEPATPTVASKPAAPAAAATQAPAPTVTPVPPTATPKPLDKVTFRLDWLGDSGSYAAFYLGVDKGFYKEAGIDLTIGEGKGSNTTTQLVAGGQDTFGFADSAPVVKAIAELDAPVKVIAGFWQKNPYGIITLAEKNVKGPKDLEGKSVGGGGNAENLWKAFVVFAKVDASKITYATVESAAEDQMLLQGKIDGLVTHVTDIPEMEAASGKKLGGFYFADYGFNNMGNSIIANLSTLKDKPDMVKRFLAATVKSWDYALKNPKEGAAVLKKYYDKVDTTVAEKVISVRGDALHTENSKGKVIGWMAQKDWEITQDNASRYLGLKKTVALDRLYTNEFLPQQ